MKVIKRSGAGIPRRMEALRSRAGSRMLERYLQLRARGQSGQGTTEYAILVGVLVVIAILAVVAFRDNLQKLWDAITDGINSL